ncbi:MAG: pyridoxamine 5'-phosphate oxidase family protein [Alphaproteobacteria bacterium]|nr:pyridoxamine 5'-phosphate oxidase family protein [Alphaproteobacteria bacterium]MCL2890125.1 pyridoxamine 5'-phosphate oxidase family protein [Alphaproteobacteria bacterium]
MTKNEILTFIDAQKIIMLGTIDLNDAPAIRALINPRNPEIAPHLVKYFKNNGRLIFITNTSSDKIAQLHRTPAAALYAYDENFNGLMLSGTVTEVTDNETRNSLWDDSWKIYYPDGRDGGDFSVLEFIPKSYKFYAGFNVTKGEL